MTQPTHLAVALLSAHIKAAQDAVTTATHAINDIDDQAEHTD